MPEQDTPKGIGEWFEEAESLGWVNPIDVLFDKYGVDNPEDLPEHEQQGYCDALDEAEIDAMEFVQNHKSRQGGSND